MAHLDSNGFESNYSDIRFLKNLWKRIEVASKADKFVISLIYDNQISINLKQFWLIQSLMIAFGGANFTM